VLGGDETGGFAGPVLVPQVCVRTVATELIS